MQDDDMPTEVAAAFDRFPPVARRRLLGLRALIVEVADELEVGPLEEALRWGEPAYLTSASKAGTTLRLGVLEGPPGAVALYVSCQTDLVATFRARHGDRLTYEGKRAVVLGSEVEVPEDVLRDCIALALTYKRRKRAGR